jgi:hypothetical protein
VTAEGAAVERRWRLLNQVAMKMPRVVFDRAVQR